jgi:hypothetical protein
VRPERHTVYGRAASCNFILCFNRVSSIETGRGGARSGAKRSY